MGGLKTLFAVLVTAVPLPGSVRAETDLLRTVAACAGRLSAEMEHQWLFGGPAADMAERRRDALIDVLDAMTPPDRFSIVLTWRIEAKHAQASLLKRATFNDDSADAAWARQRAETIVGGCNSLVLS